MYVCMYLCCMYVCMHACMYVCINVCCIYVCKNACMYVCMCICTNDVSYFIPVIFTHFVLLMASITSGKFIFLFVHPISPPPRPSLFPPPLLHLSCMVWTPISLLRSLWMLQTSMKRTTKKTPCSQLKPLHSNTHRAATISPLKLRLT